MKEKETNTTQKQIIARLELSISNKSVTIDYLTQQIMLSKRLVVNGSSVNDLLDIN